MAILTAVTIQPRSAEVWDDLQKVLKRIKDMVVKKGGENVTLLVTVIGGEATNQLVFLASSENWSKYGQVQEAFYGDPKAQALLAGGREARDLAVVRRADARLLSLPPKPGRVVRWAARPAIYRRIAAVAPAHESLHDTETRPDPRLTLPQCSPRRGMR